jgi:SAM-dependent methyltransferase
VAEATGDRGLGPLLDARPELVRVVDVGGANPDVDRPEDLAAVLANAWARRVRDNAAQVERIREAPDGPDFYAPMSRTFVADPGRTDDPVLEALLHLARPGETWLDIGAGAGRYALPLARHVREVIAVDPSASMLEALRAGMADHGIERIRALEGRWPPDAALRAALGPDPVADGALIAHVGYDIEAIGPFVDAMEAAARRLCVAVLMEGSPASIAAGFWPLVHGESRVPLPALPQFVELLIARRTNPAVTRVTGERRRWAGRDELVGFLRRQLWTALGSERDTRLLAAVESLAIEAEDGSVAIADAPALGVGIVSWAPAERR